MPYPKISIITPTLNAEKNIRDCILSVAGQHYKNIEHIIIDGGSTDGSLEIVRNLKEEYPFIRWVSEKDGGIYEGMNKGIDIAQGDWIYFLGSDDAFYNDKVLEDVFVDRQKTVANADFVYGNVLWGGTGKVYDGIFDMAKLYRRNICHQAIFVRKDLFKRTGRFNTDYRVLADWYFNALCFIDPQVRKTYIDLLIAKYSAAGLSSRKDDMFLKEIFRERNAFFNKIIKDFGIREQFRFKVEKLVAHLKGS